MPKLDSLVLLNVIPSRMLRCPALKNCSISLGHFIDNAPSWNMKQLRTFIGLSLDSVESLTMVFDGTLTSEPRLTTQAYTLFKLTTLELRVKPGTDARVLEQFMGMVDAPNLSKLKVELFRSPGSSSRSQSRWLDAIFQPTKGTIRTFPNVRDFSIITEERGWGPFARVSRCSERCRGFKRCLVSIPSIELPNFSQCKFHSDVFMISKRFDSAIAGHHTRGTSSTSFPTSRNVVSWSSFKSWNWMGVAAWLATSSASIGLLEVS